MKEKKTYKVMMSSMAQDSAIVRELTEKERDDLKHCVLEMFRDVLRVCEKHNICIMLGGGSALGSVRHQGFIPWDDDLDLLMPRADYERFAAIFQEELSEEYLLIAPNRELPAKTRFPKIIKKNTMLKELTDIHNGYCYGIFLDIFILENVPKTVLGRRLKGLLCNGLMFLGSQAFWYEHSCDEVKRFMSTTTGGQKSYKRIMTLGRVCALLPSAKWFNLVDKAVQGKKDTGFYGIPTGRKHYLGEILPKSAYLPVSEGIFEGCSVPLPGNCDAYLRNLYGNYMEIPPVEKRERHLIVDFSLNCDESTLI